MYRFVGRTRELEELTRELDEVQQTGRGRFVWLRGRRRVGKSRLVQEFCDQAGQPYCYFQASQRGRDAALVDFAEAAAESGIPGAAVFGGTVFGGWMQALRAAVSEATRERPVILVIDELPYLVAGDPGFAADLQRAWDRVLDGVPVLLIGIGSDVRMMEELVRERSPLHGRPTRQLRVAPLDPATVGRLAGVTSAAEAIDRYLVIGGLPALATSWRSDLSREAFLADALRDDQTPFAVQAILLLDAELRADLKARSVLESIGAGAVSFGRIVDRSGVSQRTVTLALETLVEDKEIVKRHLPYAVPAGRKNTRYTVDDPYLRFWLRFVGPYLAELARGRGDLVVGRAVRDWTSYRGRAVEPVVRCLLEQRLSDPSFRERLGNARHVESWWRRDNSVEVDLVGGDAPDPTTIGFVGSIKWREAAPFTAADATALQHHRASVPGGEAALLVAVSRSGFAPDVRVDVQLGPEDLLEGWSG